MLSFVSYLFEQDTSDDDSLSPGERQDRVLAAARERRAAAREAAAQRRAQSLSPEIAGRHDAENTQRRLSGLQMEPTFSRSTDPTKGAAADVNLGQEKVASGFKGFIDYAARRGEDLSVDPHFAGIANVTQTILSMKPKDRVHPYTNERIRGKTVGERLGGLIRNIQHTVARTTGINTRLGSPSGSYTRTGGVEASQTVLSPEQQLAGNYRDSLTDQGPDPAPTFRIDSDNTGELPGILPGASSVLASVSSRRRQRRKELMQAMKRSTQPSSAVSAVNKAEVDAYDRGDRSTGERLSRIRAGLAHPSGVVTGSGISPTERQEIRNRMMSGGLQTRGTRLAGR